MAEVKAIDRIVDELVGFLHILDVSIIVSGGIAYGAIISILYAFKIDEKILSVFGKWYVILVASYVLGILCYAFGKRICKGFFEKTKNKKQADFDKSIMNNIKAHSLEQNDFIKPYIDEYKNQQNENQEDTRPLFKLYVLFWSEIREYKSTEENSRTYIESKKLLSKYWTMSAVVEGCSAAICIWAIAIILILSRDILCMKVSILIAARVLIVTILIAILIVNLLIAEDDRLNKYQIEEIISTYKHMIISKK